MRVPHRLPFCDNQFFHQGEKRVIFIDISIDSDKGRGMRSDGSALSFSAKAAPAAFIFKSRIFGTNFHKTEIK